MTEVADSTVRQADTVELRMDARPENLVLARLALGGIVARTSLEDDAVADLKLAVTEACTNSIEHAYAGDPEDNEVVVRFLARRRRALRRGAGLGHRLRRRRAGPR